jgi:polyisoprenoid-binding protein YceI
LFIAGCAETSAPVGGPPQVVTTADAAPAADPGTLTLPLTPENTHIEFVCAHVGEKPDPRKGGFDRFTGKLVIDPKAQSLKSVSLDIETNSLRTEFPKLTNHLKSSDFFEVREFPKATFESTKVEPAAEGEGQLLITGNLTLHGQTREITAPATVELGPDGPKLRSEFTIDRSEFGMDYSPDKVENKVALTVVIDESSPQPQP